MRWIEAANRDFESRLRWCVTPRFEEANHKPEIHVADGLNRTVRSGETVTLKATVSDCDKLNVDALWEIRGTLYEQSGLTKDALAEKISSHPEAFPLYRAHWWQYKEAGTYDGYITPVRISDEEISFVAPEVSSPQTLHFVFEATDQGSPMLTSFARVVVTVVP